MTLTTPRAIYGLNAKAAPTMPGVSGQTQVGPSSATASFSSADVAYSVRAIFANAGDTLAIDLTTADTTGSTAFVAGNAQVETATIVAAGGCTSNGTMTLVLTSAGMTGSPLNVAVALTTTAHTTAALIATAARTALSAVAVVAARFTIGGTGADIVLTRKPTSTYTVPGGTLYLYAADDATLNLAIPSGLGVTAAASSTNTTAGTASDGVKIYDADTDFEGVAIPTIVTKNAVLIECDDSTSGVDITGGGADLFQVVPNGFAMFGSTSTDPADDTLSVAAAGNTDITITVIGQTA